MSTHDTVPYPAPVDTALRLHVLLIYEDFNAGLRAWQAFETVKRRLNFQIDFEVTVWKFDLLQFPEWEKKMEYQAAITDIVLLGSQGQADLPPAVMQWFRWWMAARMGEPTLLAICNRASHENAQSPQKSLATLKNMAKIAGVDVLLSTGNPSSGSENIFLEPQHDRTESGTTNRVESTEVFDIYASKNHVYE